MIVEDEVDVNLLYLEKLLLSLNHLEFDDDIQKELNTLRKMIEKKLYSFIPEGDYAIVSESVNLKFILKNE